MLLQNQKSQIQYHSNLINASSHPNYPTPTPATTTTTTINSPMQNHIWVGYLSWVSAGESNAMYAQKESKCELYAFPIRPNRPDLEELYTLNLFSFYIYIVMYLFGLKYSNYLERSLYNKIIYRVK